MQLEPLLCCLWDSGCSHAGTHFEKDKCALQERKGSQAWDAVLDMGCGTPQLSVRVSVVPNQPAGYAALRSAMPA